MSGLQFGRGTKLWRYWTHGEGAAKIGWGLPGDYDRAVTLLDKYVPPGQVHGLAAEMHIAATGMTTAQHAKLTKGGGSHSGKASRQAGAIRHAMGAS